MVGSVTGTGPASYRVGSTVGFPPPVLIARRDSRQATKVGPRPRPQPPLHAWVGPLVAGSMRSSRPGSKIKSPNGNRSSILITAVYKVNRQDKARINAEGYRGPKDRKGPCIRLIGKTRQEKGPCTCVRWILHMCCVWSTRRPPGSSGDRLRRSSRGTQREGIHEEAQRESSRA